MFLSGIVRAQRVWSTFLGRSPKLCKSRHLKTKSAHPFMELKLKSGQLIQLSYKGDYIA